VWLWLSAATEDVDQRIAYLRQALAINPASEKARSALLKLTGDPESLPPLPVPSSGAPGGLATPISAQHIELAVLVILGILAVFVVVLLAGNVLLPILNPPTATFTRTPTRTPAPTNTPAPTATPRPTLTLAPSWTPVPSITPLPTRTAVPTSTPRATNTLLPTRTPRITLRPSETRTLTHTPAPPTPMNTAEPILPSPGTPTVASTPASP
jgi:hypothetical protein